MTPPQPDDTAVGRLRANPPEAPEVPAQAVAGGLVLDLPPEGGAPRIAGLSAWIWLAAAILATAVVAADVVLRFVARSPLWLDEAQTVAIAKLPLHHGFTLFDGLRQDGAPPLYYLLLHGWMKQFGDSNVAVRALSGVFSVASLPLAWLVGRWLGGRRVGWVSLLLIGTSPFAIRYATESRMYSMVLFEALLGACLLVALHRWRSLWLRPLIALGLAIDIAALFYTHYWGFYLVAATGVGLLYRLVRGPDRGAALWAMGAALAGAVTLLPWLSTLTFQLHHTGTPWIHTATSWQVLSTFDFWAGDPAGFVGPVLLGCEWVLAFIAIAGHRDDDGRFVLRRPLRGTPLRLALATVGTLLIAWVTALATHSGWTPRYTAAAFAPFVVLLAFGLREVGSRVLVVVVALVMALGTAGGVQASGKLRTQAGQITRLLREHSLPGDVVGYCPDQLGPPTARLAPRWLRQYTFPGLRSPVRVDWVDYKARIHAADPISYARDLARIAGPFNQIFFVYVPTGYSGYSSVCERIANELAKFHRHEHRLAGMNLHDGEAMRLVVFVP